MRIPWLSGFTYLVAGFLLGTVPGSASALQEIEDNELSSLSAQDGVALELLYNTMNLNRIIWDLDRPTGPLGAGYDAYIMMSDNHLTGVSPDGVTTNLPATVNLKLDVGATSQTAVPALLLDANWSHARLGVNAICLGVRDGSGNVAPCTPGVSRSFGGMALDTSLSAQVHGAFGMFNANTSGGLARLVVSDAKAFFRQQTSELVWKNVDVDIGYTNGSAGFTASGFRILANLVDFDITYDIAYRGNAATPFQTTGATSLLHYGWAGSLRDFEARIVPGGIWSGAESNKSEGLKISFRNNYNSDFAWIIGDPSDAVTPRAYIHFTDWVNLPGALYTFDVPNVTVDVLRAGHGPGAINYLGTNYSALGFADADAFAIAVRDLKFLGHNTKVTLYDNSVAGYPRTLNWGLVYTFGDMDANVFLYPGGRTAALTDGMRFDAMVAVQSPTSWQGNTHFMIADTDPGKNVGFGFLNTDFLISIDNGFIELNPDGIRLAVLPDADEVTAGIQNPGDFSWALKTTFGGGYMNNLGAGSAIEGFGLDLLLHASMLDVKFTPPTSGTYIGFSWDAVLVGDSYIAISEPSAPDTAFTIGSLSGPLSVAGGKIDLRAGGESADGEPRLAFEQNLRAGRTASGIPTDVLMGTLSVGPNSIGRLAVPGGNWYGGLALKQQ